MFRGHARRTRKSVQRATRLGSAVAIALVVGAVAPPSADAGAPLKFVVAAAGTATGKPTGVVDCAAPSFNTIQAAVNASIAGGYTVHVCAGTYNETVTANVAQGWAPGKTLRLEGDARATTILDATWNGSTNAGVGHTLLASDTDTAITISALTLRNANDGAVAMARKPASNYLPVGTLSVSDCAFETNTAKSTAAMRGGGAIFGATVNIADSTFIGNRSTGSSMSGGAVRLTSGSVTNSYFSDNATTGTGADGGAIISGGALTISGSRFINNNSAHFGGAVVASSNTSAVLDISSSEFIGNRSNDGSGGGGAIWADQPITLDRDYFEANVSASQVAGAVGLNTLSYPLSVRRSEFVNNVALGTGLDGGGALWGISPIQVADSTFTGNAAGNGAAISSNYWWKQPIDLANVTFANNGWDTSTSLIVASGGLRAKYVTTVGNRLALAGSLVTMEAGKFETITDSILTEDHNICGGTGGSKALVNTLLLRMASGCVTESATSRVDSIESLGLGDLADNGSTSHVGAVVIGPGSHPHNLRTIAIVAGSPAIDAVTTDDALSSFLAGYSCGSSGFTDARGAVRQSGACDAGAFEYIGPRTRYVLADEPAANFYSAACTAHVGEAVSLESATSAALAGDTIHLCAGTYTPQRGASLIADTGWIDGDAITFEGDGQDVTIVEASELGDPFVASDVALQLVMRNFSFGNATNRMAAIEDGSGQPIGSVTVETATMNGNSGAAAGSVIFAETVTVSWSTLIANGIQSSTATLCGGAVFGRSVNILSSVFTDDSVTATGTGHFARGGAVCGDTVNVSDSTFSANSAIGDQGYGGAVYADSVTVAGSRFSDNVVDTTDGMLNTANGGAVFGARYLDVSTSSFSGNRAKDWGGALSAYDDGAILHVSRSYFVGNRAAFGGAVANDANGVSIDRSEFVDNVAGGQQFDGVADAGQGGAVYAGGDSIIEAATFSLNKAATVAGSYSIGGAILVWGQVSATNTTFATNRAQLGGVVFASESITVRGVTVTGNTQMSSDQTAGLIESQLGGLLIRNAIVDEEARVCVAAGGVDIDTSTVATAALGCTAAASPQIVSSSDLQLTRLSSTDGYPIGPAVDARRLRTMSVQPVWGTGVAPLAIGAGRCAEETLDARGVVRATPNCTAGAVEYRGAFVTAVNPIQGSTVGGESVTITGSGLESVTSVYFGDVEADSLTVTPSSVIVRTPAHDSATVTISLVSAQETVTLADWFTFVTPAIVIPPVVVPPTARPALLTWGDTVTLVYGESIGASLLNANADVTGEFKYTLDGKPVTAAVLPVSTHSLVASFTPDNGALFVAGTIGRVLVVVPAPLVVRVDSVSKVAGSADPVFTFTVHGLKNGDTMSVLGNVLPGREPGELPGQYVVTLHAHASNYAVTVAPGTLTITKAAVIAHESRLKVMFVGTSTQLTRDSKRRLRAFVAQLDGTPTRVVVIGFVAHGSTGGAATSSRRAAAVARFLKELGLTGTYSVRGNGNTISVGSDAQRVGVRITLTK